MVFEITYLIGQFAASFASSYKITNALTGFYYGKHAEDVVQGFKLLDSFYKTKNLEYIDRALGKFYNINDDDRDYVKGTAAYGKAICYTFKMKFDSAYSCLNELAAIDITWRTVKGDTLREIQNSGPELRRIIKDVEKEYWQRIASAVDDEDSGIKIKWFVIPIAIIAIVLLALVCFGVIHIG